MTKISLEEAKHIKLFNRTETKYKCDSFKFHFFLQYLYDNYYVVADNTEVLFPYMSIYFDTPEMTMYNEHKKGVQNRQKVRVRTYSNGETFLEIKQKNEEGKTTKIRIPVKDDLDIFSKLDWVKENLKYNISELKHILNVKYYRLTFISKDYHERVTVDQNIEFFNLLNGEYKTISDIVIEIKQDDKCQSNIKDIITQVYDIHECHFSKYYNGVELTQPT